MPQTIVDVNKYRALYIEESREHLETLSRALVELENASEADVTALTDEVFRHMHSVKGMSASMGYDPIASLAHVLEDVIAGTRGPVHSELIDLLLRGVDALTEQIEQIAAEQTLSQHVELLKVLRQSVKRPEGGPTAAGSGDARIVSVRLDESTASPQVRAFLVYRRLADLVEIAECTPSLEEIKAGQLTGFELRFVIEAELDERACYRLLSAVPDVELVTIEALVRKSPALAAATAAPEGESVGVSATVRVRTDVLDSLIDTVGELFIARERLRILLGNDTNAEITSALRVLASHVRDIHDKVMAVRMTPLRTLTDRYPRLLRDLSRGLGKDVELVVEGGDIELDRAILDHLDNPLVHVMRNALDHGIESPGERLAQDKPSSGKLHITATRDRDSVLITIEDDGRGLDADALKARVVSAGMITQDQADDMSAQEAFALICLPGFSTKSEVSDLSGRGVGMNSVLADIEGLGGSLDIESELGRGTRFVFRLPLTLAIIPVLLVRSADRIFAVPAAKVVAVREPDDEFLEQAGGSVYFSFQHALVRVTDLAERLGLQGGTSDFLVVLQDGREFFALAVDAIVGYQEVVVKPLGDPLDRMPWFSGATILGDGQPILILDMPKALRGRTAA